MLSPEKAVERSIKMIVFFPSDMNVGVNESGTACVRCPICDKWYKGSWLSNHFKYSHKDEIKPMIRQARRRERENRSHDDR